MMGGSDMRTAAVEKQRPVERQLGIGYGSYSGLKRGYVCRSGVGGLKGVGDAVLGNLLCLNLALGQHLLDPCMTPHVGSTGNIRRTSHVLRLRVGLVGVN
jgi:hypothetical protein